MGIKELNMGKMPVPAPVVRLVSGDENTQVVRMHVNKMDGGVDLTDLIWSVHFVTAGRREDVTIIGSPTESDDTTLTIDWIVPENACADPGNTHFELIGAIEDETGHQKCWTSGARIIQVFPAVKCTLPREDREEMTRIHEIILDLQLRVPDLEGRTEVLDGRIAHLQEMVDAGEYTRLRSDLRQEIQDAKQAANNLAGQMVAAEATARSHAIYELSEKIDEEIERSTTEDTAIREYVNQQIDRLDGNINDVIDTTVNLTNAEMDRAKGEEEWLSQSISDLRRDVTSIDLNVGMKISSVESKVNGFSETIRAMQTVDTNNSNNIASEITRAKAAESALGVRIDSCENVNVQQWQNIVELSDGINAVKKSVIPVVGEEIEWEDNCAIRTWDNPLTFNRLASTSYRCAVIECKAGDVYTIGGQGAETIRLYAFTDSSGNRLSQYSKYGNGTYVEGMQVIAPENASYIVINQVKSAGIPSCYKGEPLTAKVEDIITTFDNLHDAVEWKTMKELGISANVGYVTAISGILNTNLSKNRVVFDHIPVAKGVKFKMNDPEDLSAGWFANLYAHDGTFERAIGNLNQKLEIESDFDGYAMVIVNTRYSDATEYIDKVSGTLLVNYDKSLYHVMRGHDMRLLGVGFEYGTIDSKGLPSGTDAKRLRSSDFIPVGKGTEIHRPSCIVYWHVIKYDTRNKQRCGIALDNSRLPSVVIDEDCYVKIVLGLVTNAEFTDTTSYPIYINQHQIEDYSGIPAYYNDYLADKINTIHGNDKNIGFDADAFVHITDIHWKQNRGMRSPQLIKHIQSHTGISKVFHGGDAVTNATDRASFYNDLADFNKAFEDVEGFYNVLGNHEFNNPGGSSGRDEVMISIAEAYRMLVARHDMSIVNINEFSYYIDNVNSKIRYIMIGCNTSAQVLPATRTAVASVIASTPNGWGVVVVSHVGLTSTGSVDSFMNDIVSAMESLKSAGNAIPIAIFSGHIHTDKIITTSGGIVIVSTATDGGADETYTRTIATTTEQAFDVVQIDKENRHVYMTRIGAGSDRGFDY